MIYTENQCEGKEKKQKEMKNENQFEALSSIIFIFPDYSPILFPFYRENKRVEHT